MSIECDMESDGEREEHDRANLGVVAYRQEVANYECRECGLNNPHSRVRRHAVEAALKPAQKQGAENADQD